VLVYGTMESPLSQPRNVLGGQMLSALTSICVVQLFKLNPHWRETSSAGPGSFQDVVWVAAALAMALSQLVMDLTGTIHPPYVAVPAFRLTEQRRSDSTPHCDVAGRRHVGVALPARAVRLRHGHARLGVALEQFGQEKVRSSLACFR